MDQYHGQRRDVLFSLIGKDVVAHVRTTGISYTFRHAITSTDPSDTSHAVGLYRLDLDLLNANPHAEMLAEDQQDDVENYYLGYLEEAITDVRAYRRLRITNVYPSIDISSVRTFA